MRDGMRACLYKVTRLSAPNTYPYCMRGRSGLTRLSFWNYPGSRYDSIGIAFHRLESSPVRREVYALSSRGVRSTESNNTQERYAERELEPNELSHRESVSKSLEGS